MLTLGDLWLEFEQFYMAVRLRPSTVRGYRINWTLHIVPFLSPTLPLSVLSVRLLDELTVALRKTGLSNRSILYVHATLRKMLSFAVKRGYLASSPYGLVDLPRPERYRYSVLDENQIHRLLDLVVSDEILRLPVTLALCYGLRRGEVLGIIPCSDLDFSSGILHIQRSRSQENGVPVITPCKTESGNRQILLYPDHLRLFRDLKPDSFACPLSPASLDVYFKRFLVQYGFPDVRFHDLRHSYATLMLAKQVNPKIVCSVLGHSHVSVTLQIYSHPDVSMQSVCLNAFWPKK